MPSPRWRKVLADLWSNKVRTVLTVLSVAVGVMVVGTVATMYVILGRDMDASFAAINPASASMYTTPFDQDLLASLQRIPGVGQVEARTRLGGYKVQRVDAAARGITTGDGAPLNLELRANPDYGIAPEKSELDVLFLRGGTWPAAREMVIERNGARRLAVKPGDTVVVTQPDGREREIRLAGFVEDRTTDQISQGVYGYMGMDTLEYLGGARSFNYLEYRTAERPYDREHVKAVGALIEEQFHRAGGTVSAPWVRNGRHPNASQVQAVTAMLAAVGLLTIFLSGFLVVNTISALLTQQLRQIGVMKALGARTSQIVGMYLVLLLCLGGLALLIAAPLALLLGYFATGQIANALNFTIGAFAVEPVPLAIMVVLSLVAPALAGMAPVLSGARTTIRAAISGYGLGGQGRGLVDRALAHVRGLSRPVSISLRNSVRRKARLALTLATLTLAGAIFTAVLSTQASMKAGMAQMYRYYTADVNLVFETRQRIANIEAMLSDIPGVAAVEGWLRVGGEVMSPAERGQKRVATDRLTVTAPPSDSIIVPHDVVTGRWLLPEDTNAAVMSLTTMKGHPEWRVGDTVTLRIDGEIEEDLVIVGTFAFPNGEGNKFAFVNYEYLAPLLNQPGQASLIFVVTAPSTAATQDRVRDLSSALLEGSGYKVAVTSGHTEADALLSILNIIIVFLLLLAALIGLVGGLGLMGMMSMNVLERTREIGVMRSIGAGNGVIMELVIVEGVLTGVLSWLCGALAGLPIGRALAGVLGQGLFGNPFAFVMNWSGPAIWLAVVLVLSVVASALPAWNASRLTIREVLAYE
jgi:putative ABC transport system permease protein